MGAGRSRGGLSGPGSRSDGTRRGPGGGVVFPLMDERPHERDGPERGLLCRRALPGRELRVRRRPDRHAAVGDHPDAGCRERQGPVPPDRRQVVLSNGLTRRHRIQRRRRSR